jgi:hypothetical protein
MTTLTGLSFCKHNHSRIGISLTRSNSVQLKDLAKTAEEHAVHIVYKAVGYSTGRRSLGRRLAAIVLTITIETQYTQLRREAVANLASTFVFIDDKHVTKSRKANWGTQNERLPSCF